VKGINFPITVKLFIKRWQLSWRFTFAHHPICASYKDHYWKIKGVYICQGCTLVYSSFFVALLFLLYFQITLEQFHYLIVGVGVLIPIIIIELAKIEQRIIKRLTRILIGIGIGLFCSAFLLHDEFIVKLIGFLIIFIGFFSFKQVRRSTRREDKCNLCSEYKNNVICSGLRLEAEAMNKYSDYASDLLQDNLKEKYFSKLKIKNKQ
jgi:hypothetical protein